MAQDQDIVTRGVDSFKRLTRKVADTIRSTDEALSQIDSAIGVSAMAPMESSEATLVNVLAVMKATVDEARNSGNAQSPQVITRSREILKRVTDSEPSWRAGPASIKTANDIFRVALRDLRASQNLIKLASGNGGVDDLDALVDWADQVSNRINNIQKAVTESKGNASKPVESKPKKKRASRKKQVKKVVDENVRFAELVAEEYDDDDVKEWARQYASGQINEEAWVAQLTEHAAQSGRDNIDDIFQKARERLEKEKE